MRLALVWLLLALEHTVSVMSGTHQLVGWRRSGLISPVESGSSLISTWQRYR